MWCTGWDFHTYTAYRATPLLIAAVSRVSFPREHWCSRLLWPWRRPLGIYALTHWEEVFHRSAEVSIFNGPKSVAAYLLENIWKMAQMIFTRGDIGLAARYCVASGGVSSGGDSASRRVWCWR